MAESYKVRTIDGCVEESIRNGNHEAFADYLFHRNVYKEQNFISILISYIQNIMRSQGLSCSKNIEMVNFLMQFGIISASDWNSYTSDLSSDQVKIQKQTIRKWLNGDIMPQREIIIQICLCLALTVEESDKLLMAGGYPVLYCGNISDMITLFYLQKNCFYTQLTETQFMQIKKDYNHLLRLIQNKPEYGTRAGKGLSMDMFAGMESRNMKRGGKSSIRYVDPVAGDYYDISDGKISCHPFKGMRPAYDQNISVHADQVIYSVGQQTSETAGYSRISVTNYLQKTAIDSFETPEDFFQFVENNVDYFGEIHYGLHQKLRKYLSTSDFYYKNIFNYTGSFTLEDEGYILNSKLWSQDNELICGGAVLMEHASETNKRSIITTILSMEYENIKDEWMDLRASGLYSDLSLILNGRKEKDPLTGKIMYTYKHPSKVMLLRLLIAMGREDEIGTMMIQSGYWDNDWIIDAGAEECDYLDLTDLLIIYMVRFRNKLLESWAELQKKDKITYLNQSRRAFPFHRMMLEISDEIMGYAKKSLYKEEQKRFSRYFPVHNSNMDSDREQ